MWARRAADMAILLSIPTNAALARGISLAATKNRMHSQVGHTEFMSWLRKRGEDVDSLAVNIGISKHGRALFASRPICAGECMMRFTQNLVLTPEKLPKDVSCLLKEANEFTRVALLLLAEQHKGPESAWAPYIDCLPSSGEIHSPIFWEAEEQTFLECSPLFRGTCERDYLLRLQYKEVKQVVESCPHIFGESVSLERFKHAYATVSSRAWGEGPHSNMTMIPLVDFANHDPRVRTIFSEDDNCTVVVADQDYQTGDEVHICYGKHSNAVLALDYGFVVLDNPYDEAEIWLEISAEDPLREEKLQLLLQNNMPTLKNPDSSQSGGRPFLIMEVDRASGKDFIIPSAARAFSRVICSDSLEDLENLKKEAEAYSGAPFAFRPRQDINKEHEAMYFLLSVIQAHIDAHLEAIEGLHNITRPFRRQIAEYVLHGELQLLQKATDWLKKRSNLN